MSGSVFISYRRGDDPGFARLLYDHLSRALPSEKLFLDVESIRTGADYVDILERQTKECDVLIAVIGEEWLNARDDQGRRRLDLDGDFVRVEIVSALKAGKEVIPLMIGHTRMLQEADLPAELKPLARRNAERITHEYFSSDVERLVRTLRSILPQAASAAAEPPVTPAPWYRRYRTTVTASVALIAILMVGAALFSRTLFSIADSPASPPMGTTAQKPSEDVELRRQVEALAAERDRLQREALTAAEVARRKEQAEAEARLKELEAARKAAEERNAQIQAAREKAEADAKATLEAIEAQRRQTEEARLRAEEERAKVEADQRVSAAQIAAAQAEGARRKAAEDEARKTAPHPAAAVAGKWAGLIDRYPDDPFRTFVVTLLPSGGISCLWYWKDMRDPAKFCRFNDSVVDLVTAADSIVRLRLSGDVLRGFFRLQNGTEFTITMQRSP